MFFISSPLAEENSVYAADAIDLPHRLLTNDKHNSAHL